MSKYFENTEGLTFVKETYVETPYRQREFYLDLDRLPMDHFSYHQQLIDFKNKYPEIAKGATRVEIIPAKVIVTYDIPCTDTDCKITEALATANTTNKLG